MHGIVGSRIEGIHVWLMDAGAGQPDEGAGAEGDDRVGGEGEAQVSFHRAILVAGADGAELEFESAGVVAGGFLCVIGAVVLRNGVSLRYGF